jgi:deoxyribodipyrimidine photo-lyase
MISFPTSPDHIHHTLQNIRPQEYGQTRNFINGAVTYLSPYISRGILQTKDVFEHLKANHFTWEQSEKLIQELAWRDFFKLTWMRLGEIINHDIKQEQSNIRSYQVPKGIIEATTGIEAIDKGIQGLYQTGYMHNHLRMYTASLACNVSQCHWKTPAHWMYYHLLDGDWGSNACSWQWVAGAFSQKKYYANQENINRYALTQQSQSYLDVSYEQFQNIPIPSELKETTEITFQTNLPETSLTFKIDQKLPSLIYNWYNLDFKWHPDLSANRILLLEPEVFKKYPISDSSVDFLLKLSSNIPKIQVFKGSFEDLKKLLGSSNVIYKEHPLNQYHGIQEPSIFLSEPPQKNFTSFFGFWKFIEVDLKKRFLETSH